MKNTKISEKEIIRAYEDLKLTSKPHKNHRFILHFLTVLVLLGIVGYVFSIYGKDKVIGIIQNNSFLSGQYSWQKTCDSACAEKVGKGDMAQIDVSGCTDLDMMTSFFGPMYDKEHLAAVNDKTKSLHCYEYSWLKTCDASCVSVIGGMQLSTIDRENCQDIAGAMQYTQFTSPEQNRIAFVKALNDRATFLNCGPLPPPDQNPLMNQFLKFTK